MCIQLALHKGQFTFCITLSITVVILGDSLEFTGVDFWYTLSRDLMLCFIPHGMCIIPHLLFMLDPFYMVPNPNSIQINLNPDQVDFSVYLHFFVTLAIVFFAI